MLDKPEWVNQQGLTAQREYLFQTATGRLAGKFVNVEGVGEVKITRPGIRKILSQPLSDHELFSLKNTLALVTDSLLINSEILTTKVSKNIEWHTLKIKGLKKLYIKVRMDKGSGIKTIYTITDNL
jgi:hypothetical protein